MPKIVALLRAINVGGHTVTMAKLRDVFEDLGFEGVETFIASGNVLFTSKAKNLGALERTIESRLERELGYEVTTFLRTVPELVAVADYQPFPAAKVRSAAANSVGFLKQPLDAAARKSLAGFASGVDHFATHGREVYWLSDIRQGESKFSNVLFEKLTRSRVTFRGINTVARLAAKAAAQ